ncbi:hypothetical protein ABZW11_26545 [Nonomuraea sp. NPDC004580]|uniref:hypothetical protein n=1 Tax=Nonomuraea sp. NPDC004580 TaxID=3154552 RepID=UPI0033AA0F4A
MQIQPRYADILANDPRLTPADHDDFARFVTTDPDEQQAIVQQIRDTRTTNRTWIVRAGDTGNGPDQFCVYAPTMTAARTAAGRTLGDTTYTVHAARDGEKLPETMTLAANPTARTTPAPDYSPVPAYYRADLQRFDNLFRKADAIVTLPDGFAYIDEEKAPADAVRAYRLLMQFAMANGWPLSLEDRP